MSALKPDTDDTHDLGSSALRWRNLYVHDIDIATNIATAGSFVFEGDSADAHETTFGVVEPTADAIINLPAMSAGTYHLPVLAAASTTAITATPEELNLLDATAGAGLPAGAGLATGDALIIGDASDGNATKKVLMSDVITLLSNTTFTFTNLHPVTIQDATAASSDTTGALIVTGGISTAADLFVGDDLVLVSDNAELVFGANKEVKLVHNDALGGLILTNNGETASPVFELRNTNADETGSTLKFNKDGASVADGDVVGNIDFTSEDDGSNEQVYARINSTIDDASAGAEQGGLDLYVAANDGTLAAGLQIQGTTSAGVVDVTVGLGAASTVTIPGNLTVSGTTTQVDTANLNVTDKNILINDGGSTAGTTGAGLDIEGDGEAIVGYMRVGSLDNANLEFKAPGDVGVLTLDINATKTVTVAGALNISGDSVINQDLSATSTAAAFTTLTINTSLLPNGVGGADIGSATAEFGDVYIAKNKEIKLGNQQEVTIAHDDVDGLDITAAGSIDLVATADHITAAAGTNLLLDAVGVLELNSSGGIISIGNDAVAQNINVGTGGAARIITMGNITGATALALNAGTGGIALASTGDGDITLDSDDTLLLDSDGILELNSSAGVISIGNDAVDQAINIGTAGVREVTVGAAAANDNSGLTLRSNKGGIDIDCSQATGALSLDTAGGAIEIGVNAAAGAINIGTNETARTITVGNVTGTTALALNAGTGGIALASTGAGDISLDSDDTLLLDSDGVLELNASAGVISIGNKDVDQNINIGTDGERTIQIGTDNGTGSAPSTKVDINAGEIELDAATKVLMSTDAVDITSDQTTDPLVRIVNTTNDANGARLRFVKDKGAAGADDDVAGLIEFFADDANQDQVKFAEVKAQVADATQGSEGGKLTLSVASHDGELVSGIIINGSSQITDNTCDYNNDPTITMDSTAAIRAGMSVSGTGIPAGAFVSSVTNGTTFELSASTTDGAVTNGTLTFGNPEDEVDVFIGNGSDSVTTIRGDLVVSGTTTTIESTVLTVADDLITVSKGNDSVANADGSGMEIDVTGGTNLHWKYVHGNTALSANTDIDVASGKAYKINGTSILNATTLANTVTSAAGLTTVGALSTGGSITTGFGNIDNGESNITTGGLLKIDVDGTAVGAVGSLTLGAGGDAGLFVTNSSHPASEDHLIIENTTSNKDIVIRGNDGGSAKDILTVDVSAPKVITRGGLTVTDDAALASATKLLEIDPDDATPFHVTAASKVTGALTVTGRVTGQDIVVLSDTAQTSDGVATPVTNHATWYQTGGAETSSLAAGTEGQIKVLAMHTDGGDMVVTVTNAGWKSSGTGTITLSAIGQACTLQYINSKWFCIGNNGVAFG